MKCKRLLSFVMAGLVLGSTVGGTVVTYAADTAVVESTESPSGEQGEMPEQTEVPKETPTETPENPETSEENEKEGPVDNQENDASNKKEDSSNKKEEDTAEKAKVVADSVVKALEEKEYNSAAEAVWKDTQPYAVLYLVDEKQRELLYENLDETEIYLLKTSLKYDMAEEHDEAKKDASVIDQMLELYLEVPSVKPEDTEKADELFLKVINERLDEDYSSLDQFTDAMEADFDVYKVLILMQELWDAPSDRITAKTKEVKAYLYSVYGFDEPEEELDKNNDAPDGNNVTPEGDIQGKEPAEKTPSDKPDTEKEPADTEKGQGDTEKAPADVGSEEAGSEETKAEGTETEDAETNPEDETAEDTEAEKFQKAVNEINELIFEAGKVDFEKVMDKILALGEFFEVYSALEQNAQLKFPNAISSHDAHVLEMTARYSLVKTLIAYQAKETVTESDMEMLGRYVDRYKEMAAKTYTSYLTQTEKKTSKEAALAYLNLENNAEITDLDAYAAHMQSATDLDVMEVLAYLYKFIDPKVANVENSALEFKAYLCSLFGFAPETFGWVKEETSEEPETKFVSELDLKEISEQYNLVEDYFKAAPNRKEVISTLSAKEAYQAMLLVRYESVKRFYIDTDLDIYFELIERYKESASDKDDLEGWKAEAATYIDEYGYEFGFLNLKKVKDFDSYQEYLQAQLLNIDAEEYYSILEMFFTAETEEEKKIAEKALNDYKGELFGTSFRYVTWDTGIRDGRYWDHYFQTLNEATNEINNGGTIYIRSNRSMTGLWNIPNYKTITIAPEGGNWGFFCDAWLPHSIICGTGSNITFATNGNNHFYFDGNWNQSKSENTSAIIWTDGTLNLHNVELFESNHIGIIGAQNSSVNIYNSTVRNCVYSGIMSARGLTIQNTTTYWNSNDGVTVMADQYSGTAWANISGLTTYENGRAGIAFGSNGGAGCWNTGNVSGLESCRNKMGVYVNNGGSRYWTVNLNSGEIYSNTNDFGAGLTMNGGTFNLRGGSFYSNTATWGGAIGLNGGTFNMSGGAIEYNRGTTHGGGIYLKNSAVVNLSGGVISSNTTGNRGAGIFYENGSLNMSGNANVNINNEVYLPAGKYINVTGALNNGTVCKIGPADYYNGRKVVQVSYGSCLGSMVSSKFQLVPNSSWLLWAGNSMNGTPTNAVVITKTNTLDVNGNLNGVNSGNTSGWLTFDVYINGGLVANDVSDYCTAHPMGTTYRITDVRAVGSRRYLGVSSGSASGTLNGAMSTYLKAATLYTVKYHGNGNTGGSTAASTHTYNEAKALTANGFTKTGYSFVKWTTNANGTGTAFSNKQTVNNLASGAGAVVNLYAQWNPKQLVTTFHRNCNASDKTTAQQTFTYDVAGQKFSNKGWTRTGYTLLGWSDSQTAVKQQYAILSGVSNEWINAKYPKNDVYAVWNPHKYTVVFDGNGATGGSTPELNVTYDQTVKIPDNGFVKGPFKFVEWNTKPDGSGTTYTPGQDIKNLTSKDGDKIILYAVWEETMKVAYDGNAATAGTKKVETVTEKILDEQYNYTVHKNKGYTDYAKTGNQFDGWNDYQYAIRDGNYDNLKDSKVNKISWERLQKIADEQAAKAKQTPMNVRFRAVGFAALADTKAAKEMKTATMYAQWDTAPTLNVDDGENTRTFYEGVDIKEADLLKGVTVSDKEDDQKGLDLDVKVVKIEYAAGKLTDGKKQPAYTETYKNGMTDADQLDTWFLQMEKNNAAIKKGICHKVTYQVTDSGGNTVQVVGNVYVKYNEFPTITAEDRYFTLEEAQAGVITQEALLNNQITSKDIVVIDKEEGAFTTPGTGPKKVDLLDFDAEEFKQFNDSGYRMITIHTQDSYGSGGKGKETTKQIVVYVVKDGEIPDVNKAKEVRFIDKKNYDKNKDVDPETLSEAEIEERNGNGGLNVNSVWYHDPEYRSTIEESFNTNDGTSYHFTYDEVEQVKEYVDTHGIGNMEEEDALSNFADRFLN